jgi:D-lactate dehydrogenase (cytochrome)
MVTKSDPEEIQGYFQDASNLPGGRADVVYFPESEDDVVAALAESRRAKRAVTVSGAGTGLAGGRVPFGGAVISTSRMNAIISIDSSSRRAVVSPGVILGEFQSEVERHDLLYPPDPTERSCYIGGTVATNASGARTFKYGPTRDYVERLRVVLADGDRLELRRGSGRASGNNLSVTTESGRSIDLVLPPVSMPNVKHAAGYWIRPDMEAIDLFIGSEGTLGVITEIELRLIPLPERLFSGVIFFRDEAATMAFVRQARDRSRATRASAAENLSSPFSDIDARALEYLDEASLQMIRGAYPQIPQEATGGAIWFEQESTEEVEDHLLGAWYELIEQAGGMIDESWFGLGSEEQRRIREFRHAIPEAVYEYITEHGQLKLGSDMAVPDDAFEELLGFYRGLFQEADLRTVTYGHVGNSHLHANILCRTSDEFTKAQSVYRRMVTEAIAMGGTISAEHGVGKVKTEYLQQMYGSAVIEGMRRLKVAFDPDGMLGPGTMFSHTQQ